MATQARTKSIRVNAANAAEQRNVSTKNLEKFMAKKIDIDTRLNDQLDELLAEFRKEIAVFIGKNIKFNPATLNDILSEHTAKMKEVLAATTLIFASLGDSAYKVIVKDFLAKGLNIIEKISIEMNDLRDEIEDIKKQ